MTNVAAAKLIINELRPCGYVCISIDDRCGMTMLFQHVTYGCQVVIVIDNVIDNDRICIYKIVDVSSPAYYHLASSDLMVKIKEFVNKVTYDYTKVCLSRAF